MTTIGQQLLQEITTTAQNNGAILVGTTKIRRSEPVIIFGFPYSEKWFFNFPYTMTKWLGRDYLTSKEVQNKTADILIKAGYRAEYKTLLSVFGDFRPLAAAAGLGEWGRNGLIVNKKHGSNLLFASIFTDAPLEVAEPITPEIPVEHCTSCGHCIEACPAHAFEGGHFQYRKCLPYSVRGCSECIKACSGERS